MNTVSRVLGAMLCAVISGSFLTAVAEIEPNNTPASASVLLVNSTNNGSLNANTDNVDWWKVTLPADGALIIATLSATTLEIDNYIFDQNGTTQLARYLHSGTQPEDTSLVMNLAAGTYYVATSGYSGQGTYTITARFLATQYVNDAEPNDSAGAALPMIVNTSGAGHLGYYGGGYTDVVDWRRVDIPSDGKLVIATYADPTLEIDNSIYDTDKTTRLARYKYAGSHPEDTSEVVNITAGTYYICTSAYNGYGSYTIKNLFTPALLANDAEPNNTTAQAQPLALNTTTTGHLGYYHAGETDMDDYYSLTLSSAVDTLFVRTDSNPSVEIDIEVTNTGGHIVAKGAVYGVVEQAVAATLPAGIYYVRVKNWSGYGSYSLIASTMRPSGQPLGIARSEAQTPAEFSLEQNFPNPFNPATTIRYSIASAAPVRLIVYDMLGREVAAVVNEMQQPGTYAAAWNARTLPSGVYVYRLTAGNHTAVKKLVLQK